MAFVQLVQFTTTDLAEVQALDERWAADTAGRNTVRRSRVCEDRNQPGRYVVIVEFDSNEDAARNNDLPETSAFAEQLGKLADDMSFVDLDVRYDLTP